MAQVTLKQGDTTPEFTAHLTDAAQDLTGNETIRFYMEHQDTGDLIVNQPVSSVDYAADPPTVTYDFGAGETSREGTHLAEVVATYSDGEIQSFPADGYYQINITQPTNREVAPADLDAPDITVGVVDASQVSAPTLQAVETLTGSITGGDTLSNITGAGLSIDGDGDLNITNTLEDTPSHYNPTYDSNTDGMIDADVNNTNTASDVTTTRELFTNSIPTRVRLYQESGTVYAVDGDTLVDSGSDASTVIQSAVDHIHADFDANPPTEASRVVGWIDGGGDTFAQSSQIVWKDGVGFKHLTLDGGGTAVSGGEFGFSVRARPTITGRSKVSGIGCEDVNIINNGGAGGLRMENGFWNWLDGLTVYNCGGNGVSLEGCITTSLVNPRIADNGGNYGAFIIDSPEFAGNFNRILYGNFINNGKSGVRIDKINAPATNTDHNIIFGSNFRANGDAIQLANGARNTRIMWNWMEGSENINVGPESPTNKPQYTFCVGNKIKKIDVRDAVATELIRNRGEANMEITIESGATQTECWRNMVENGTFVDNGVRTRRNGLGQASANAEEPDPNYWYVGEMVDFTDTGDGSGSGLYVLLTDGSTWAGPF